MAKGRAMGYGDFSKSRGTDDNYAEGETDTPVSSIPAKGEKPMNPNARKAAIRRRLRVKKAGS